MLAAAQRTSVRALVDHVAGWGEVGWAWSGVPSAYGLDIALSRPRALVV
ncbi:hypothetical protein [Amycolatopsis sulphurea]|nr:hypothetical protein [Amycolatopsis sulphurea]